MSFFARCRMTRACVSCLPAWYDLVACFWSERRLGAGVSVILGGGAHHARRLRRRRPRGSAEAQHPRSVLSVVYFPMCKNLVAQAPCICLDYLSCSAAWIHTSRYPLHAQAEVRGLYLFLACCSAFDSPSILAIASEPRLNMRISVSR